VVEAQFCPLQGPPGMSATFGDDRICAVVAAPTAREMRRLLALALRETRTVELRLDYLEEDAELNSFLAWWRNHPVRGRVIATCRSREAGGRFAEDRDVQAGILADAADCGALWCDLEEHPQAPQETFLTQVFLDEARSLLSVHNFRETPRDLPALLQRLDRYGADAVKIATQCNSLADCLRLLAITRGRRDVVAVPMGECGLPARVLALRHGSALAYAAAGEPTAPGQLTLREMKHLYRADRLNRSTRVYGVIGNPIGHSLSPVLHNSGFHARGVNAVYLPFRVADLRDFLGAVKPLGIAGFSVTLPHKEAIVRHLDGCDPLAGLIGAVNTVVVRGGGKLYGYNTDYVGVLRALERRLPLAGSRVLVLGAGGAARAAAFALAQGGAIVGICARRRRRAAALARDVGGVPVDRKVLGREFFDAIINATPVGMHPRSGESPLNASELNCRVVMDMVYRPAETRLLRLARRKGLEAICGLEMFIAQGTAQWEIWMGERAPVAAMRTAVKEELKKVIRQEGEEAGR